MSVDVAIVGGGVMGCSAAWFLSSTPADQFHLQCEQVEKPPVAFTPKTLFRLKAATATRADSAAPFRPVIATGASRAAVRVVVCSGKIAYDVEAAADLDRTAIVRLEDLCPFPSAALQPSLSRHPHADVVWLQEEPRNSGAVGWVAPRLEAAMGRPVRVVSRPESPSPAGGFHGRHDTDQARLVDEALAPGGCATRRAA